METRKPLDGQAAGIMLVLCMIWGLQQVALKAGAADVAPLLQIALRSGVAAVLVALLMRARGERLYVADGSWRPGLVAGLLFAFEFLLAGEALRHTSAAHTAVFLYTAPIFAALGLHWKLPAERLAPLQWLGIGLALGGIVLAFVGGEHASGEAKANSLWGDFLALVAGAAWGATTVVIRCSSLASAPATRTVLYQLVAAFVLLVPAVIALGQAEFNPTPFAWGNLVFQSLIVSFASYLAWFRLLRHYLASRLGVFSFMTPLFGVAFGAWLLGETIEPNFLAGAGLVLAGVVLVSGHGWFAQLVRRSPAKACAPVVCRAPGKA